MKHFAPAFWLYIIVFTCVVEWIETISVGGDHQTLSVSTCEVEWIETIYY